MDEKYPVEHEKEVSGVEATLGITLNWNSPFGPIRFDIGRDIVSEEYDDAKFFRFSGGTRF